jgi:hypothetical protein
MMDKTTTIDPLDLDSDATGHEALVDQYIDGLKHIIEEMTDDRKEILRLQAETRAILDDIMTMLKAA